MTRPRVALTLIARDEERDLPDCLASVAGLFDEVVVLDTGSRDRTREVAAALGAAVFAVAWPDSFAAARNAALDRAAGGWAFRLDADERLDPASRDELRAVLAALPDPLARPDGFTARVRHAGAGPAVELDEVRLFPRRPDVRWEYRVHEQIAPAVRAAGGAVRRTGVRLSHAGYADPARARLKLARNRDLLERDRADRPGDPFVLFYLGWTRLDLGDAAGAAEALAAAAAGAPADFPLLAHAHATLARARLAARRPDLALAAVRAGRAARPRDAELACLEGELLQAAGDGPAAAALFSDLLAGRFVEDPRPPGGGACGHRPRHGLACLLPAERSPAREGLWREAVALRPDFGPAWLGLGELLAAAGRVAELGRLAAEAEAALPGSPEAAVLRARRASLAGDHRGARRELGRCCARHPAAVLPRLALAQTILLEGRDRAAAARVLAEVEGLAPGHPEAARLRALLARWGG